MPEPAKRDASAPKFLEIFIKDSNGKEWNSQPVVALAKEFSTGSVGYYSSGKVENPEGNERYQVSVNITLIGSKPK